MWTICYEEETMWLQVGHRMNNTAILVSTTCFVNSITICLLILHIILLDLTACMFEICQIATYLLHSGYTLHLHLTQDCEYSTNCPHLLIRNYRS
jgi:hypothetical protein